MVLGTTCTSLNFITLFTLGGLISLNTSHRFYELHRDSVRSKLDGLLFDPGYQGHEVISITPKRDRRSIDPTKTQHTFQAFKKDFELSLQPAEDVVSPQLVLMRRRPGDVWTKELYTPEGTFLQGHVTQDPRSHVAVRELGSNQLSGAIISGGHEYKIEPVPHHIRRKMDLEGHGHHVISRRSLRSKRSHAEPFKDHEVSISKSASRRRRDLRETKYIEAMITMDKPTTDFYGDKSMDYVLAIANMANRLYADKSVGFPLVFCLTKVFLIESNLPALDIVKNKIDSASRYLHVFSKWFQTVNTPEGSAEHFDNAVMLTSLHNASLFRRAIMGDEPASKEDLSDFKKFVLDQLSSHQNKILSDFHKAKEAADEALLTSKQEKELSQITLKHPGNDRNYKFNREVIEKLKYSKSSLLLIQVLY
ncbi:predicted protein [Nematostella vectensis]|uniref:Peptidase M12B propeptide domain-containing protein n=1 Tax=Nematostella vectensis TaxID=45351 RepID=A7SQN3_NEMVE|nr:predicted protein [Nematostella vectensis]|eukprot:XP_001626085.1 predicted protein [Nematostella vectensis]